MKLPKKRIRTLASLWTYAAKVFAEQEESQAPSGYIIRKDGTQQAVDGLCSVIFVLTEEKTVSPELESAATNLLRELFAPQDVHAGWFWWGTRTPRNRRWYRGDAERVLAALLLLRVRR